MDRRTVGRSLAAILAAIVCLVGPARAGHYVQQEPGSPREQAPVTFLQINDVYSTVPIDGAGGLARVATLKRQLAASGHTPFMILAGDFLSPSVASNVFKGSQMIAALNAAGLDLATLGNHEFDFGDDVLIERMREAKWQWVVSNVVDKNTGKPIGGAAPYVVKTFGPLKVGFIGLCLVTEEISRDKLSHTRLVDPLVAAARYLPMLRRAGATTIVAVTHLAFGTDRALVQRFPQIDLVIGGHEHYPITATENRTLVSKAGSDARWVARIDVARRRGGTLERFFELMPITAALADEPTTAAVVASYETKLGAELDVVVGASRTPLDAVSVRMRASETNIGDLVADAMRADTGADLAIMNAGSIRGDRIYAAGPLTRRTLLEMLPFGNVICKIALPGRVVLQALNSGVAELPASAGRFPQVSGITMRVEATAAAGNRLRDVKVDGASLDPERSYTVAIPDYLLKGGDGYTMFAGAKVLIGPETGNLMVSALEKYVAAKGEIAPALEGRTTVVR